MATLTAAKRKKLPQKSFALPGGRYPIHDESHARNALARVSQHGTPEEKKKVRNAVKRKYPHIVQEVETFSKPGTADVTPADMKRLAPLVKHYGAMAHTFTVCKRDQIKHGLSEEHANRRCAVIKMLAGKGSGGKGKLQAEYVPLVTETVQECRTLLEAARETVGAGAVAEMATQPPPDPERFTLQESNDVQQELHEAIWEASVALEVYVPLLKEVAAFDPSQHPRGTGQQGGQFVAKGASGSSVKTVQKKVGAKTDGQFGKATTKAVRQFQRQHGLQVDGVVGAQTVAAFRGQKAAPGSLTQADLNYLSGGRGGVRHNLPQLPSAAPGAGASGSSGSSGSSSSKGSSGSSSSSGTNGRSSSTPSSRQSTGASRGGGGSGRVEHLQRRPLSDLSLRQVQILLKNAPAGSAERARYRKRVSKLKEDQELQEGVRHVQAYTRQGRPVAGYDAIISALKDLANPDHPTNRVEMPGGIQVRHNLDRHGGRYEVRRMGPDPKSRVGEVRSDVNTPGQVISAAGGNRQAGGEVHFPKAAASSVPGGKTPDTSSQVPGAAVSNPNVKVGGKYYHVQDQGNGKYRVTWSTGTGKQSDTYRGKNEKDVARQAHGDYEARQKKMTGAVPQGGSAAAQAAANRARRSKK